jgi:hypothetical protein
VQDSTVVDAEPFRLPATTIFRSIDVNTSLAGRTSEDNPKELIVNYIGTNNVNTSGKTPKELIGFCCHPSNNLDIIFEVPNTTVTIIDLLNHTSRSSFYVMVWIVRGELVAQLDTTQLFYHMVH